MEELPYEIKTLIHHVLHRHNIYQLPLSSIRHILFLLDQTSNEQPLDIQDKIFKGVVHFQKIYRYLLLN